MKLYIAIALVQVCSIFINPILLLSASPINYQRVLAQETSPQQPNFFENSEPPTEPGGRSGEAGDAGTR